jgi:RNA recognition motif-containing protein
LDKISGKKRGFAFVRFCSFQEAKKAMEIARGRSWGGRRIHVQLSKFKQSFTTHNPTIKVRPGSSMRQEKNLRDPVKSSWAGLFKTHEKNLSPQSKKGWVSFQRAGYSRG